MHLNCEAGEASNMNTSFRRHNQPNHNNPPTTMMRKRSRCGRHLVSSQPTIRTTMNDSSHASHNQPDNTQSTILTPRKGRLYKWCLLLGLVSLQITTASSPDSSSSSSSSDSQQQQQQQQARFLLHDRRRQADRTIRQRYLSGSNCIDCIVTFATAPGNTDTTPLGPSDFARTNARALRCVTQDFYDSLLQSSEVLLVELDAMVNQTSSSGPVVEDNEIVPNGASLILESSWNEIPDPGQQSQQGAGGGGGSSGSAGPMTICIVDSGLLVDHPDIPYSMEGSNIMGQEFDLPDDVHWYLPGYYAYHGTHLAGTMLAQGYNEQGIRGIIPRNAGFNLMIARVFGEEMLSSALTSTIDMAIEWCANNGARVINLSFASGASNFNSDRILTRLVTEENILVVAAAGNQGNGEPAYPAAYDHVMSVGSINGNLQRSEFSQYGPTLDVVAPGEDVYSTVSSSGVFDDQSTQLDAGPMLATYTSTQPISGEIFDCGTGSTVCEGALGRVCLVEHASGLPFQALAEHCEGGGGLGLVIFPSSYEEDLEGAVMDFTYLGTLSVVTVDRSDGLRLRQSTQASISFTVPAYRTHNGTSMAAAHVSAIAAKLWAARPQCTNVQIRQALEATALDLGAAGRDDEYGHGMVRGVAAYHYLLDQPEPCGTAGGSGGFSPNGGIHENPDIPVSLRKTPHDIHKTKVCDYGNRPFCGRNQNTLRRRNLRQAHIPR